MRIDRSFGKVAQDFSALILAIDLFHPGTLAYRLLLSTCFYDSFTILIFSPSGTKYSPLFREGNCFSQVLDMVLQFSVHVLLLYFSAQVVSFLMELTTVCNNDIIISLSCFEILSSYIIELHLSSLVLNLDIL